MRPACYAPGGLEEQLAAESRAVLVMLWLGYTLVEAEDALRPQHRSLGAAGAAPSCQAGSTEVAGASSAPSARDGASSASTSRACRS